MLLEACSTCHLDQFALMACKFCFCLQFRQSCDRPPASELLGATLHAAQLLFIGLAARGVILGVKCGARICDGMLESFVCAPCFRPPSKRAQTSRMAATTCFAVCTTHTHTHTPRVASVAHAVRAWSNNVGPLLVLIHRALALLLRETTAGHRRVASCWPRALSHPDRLCPAASSWSTAPVIWFARDGRDPRGSCGRQGGHVPIKVTLSVHFSGLPLHHIFFLASAVPTLVFVLVCILSHVPFCILFVPAAAGAQGTRRHLRHLWRLERCHMLLRHQDLSGNREWGQ